MGLPLLGLAFVAGTALVLQGCDDAEQNPQQPINKDPEDTGDSFVNDPTEDKDQDGFLSCKPEAEASCIAYFADRPQLKEDCNDEDADSNPDAVEVCDGYDNDCDGLVDNNVADGVWKYVDADGDGYGDAALEEQVCATAAGYVDNADDCDDTNEDIHPGQNEDETLIGDEDCDGQGIGSLADLSTRRISGSNAGDHLGTSLIGGVDYTNDGIPDVVVGAPAQDNDEPGKVIIMPGSGDANGWDDSSIITLTSTSNDYAGYSIAHAGDMNNDGFADLIVGAYGDSTNGIESGAATLVFGPISSGSLDNGNAVYGIDSGDKFGRANIMIQEGLLASGAALSDYAGVSSGAVVLLNQSSFNGSDWSSSAESIIYNSDLVSNDLFGAGIASADFDGDGIQDIAIGATRAGLSKEGAVYVVSLNDINGPTDIADLDTVVINGDESNTDFGGMLVADTTDINDDGISDLLIGDYYKSSSYGPRAGVVHLVTDVQSGSIVDVSSLSVYGGVATYSGSNASFSDVNGDGSSELLVVSTGSHNAKGAVFLINPFQSGTVYLNDESWFITGESDEDFVNSISNVGDIDNDGIDNIAIGAENASYNGSQSGSAYLLFSSAFQSYSN